MRLASVSCAVPLCLLLALILSINKCVSGQSTRPPLPASDPPSDDNAITTVPDERYESFKIGDVFGLQAADGKYCFLGNFGARLTIKNFGGLLTDRYEYLDPTGDLSGNCGSTVARFEISWKTKRDKSVLYDRFRVEFVFEQVEWINPVKNLKEFWWKLAEVTVTYTPPFSRTNETVTAVMSHRHSPDHELHEKSPSGVNAPMGQSLYCKHGLNVTLVSMDNRTIVDAMLQFAGGMTLQPFEVSEGGMFGTKYLCERSQKIHLLEQLRSSATIGMGALLGVATVGVLIGYSVKRNMFPGHQSYDNIE